MAEAFLSLLADNVIGKNGSDEERGVEMRLPENYCRYMYSMCIAVFAWGAAIGTWYVTKRQTGARLQVAGS